jgi:hypothetical protein
MSGPPPASLVRVSDEHVEQMICELPFTAPNVILVVLPSVLNALMDLRDSRARLRELEALVATARENDAAADRDVRQFNAGHDAAMAHASPLPPSTFCDALPNWHVGPDGDYEPDEDSWRVGFAFGGYERLAAERDAAIRERDEALRGTFKHHRDTGEDDPCDCELCTTIHDHKIIHGQLLAAQSQVAALRQQVEAARDFINGMPWADAAYKPMYHAVISGMRRVLADTESAAAAFVGRVTRAPDRALWGIMKTLDELAEGWRAARDRRDPAASPDFWDGGIHAFNEIARTDTYRVADEERKAADARLRGALAQSASPDAAQAEGER